MRNLLALIGTVWMLCATQWATAFVQISGLDDFSLLVWNGTGGITGSDTYCIISRRSTTNNTPRRYDVAATGPDDGAGNFVLLHTVTAAQLPIQFVWAGNQGTYTMTDYAVTGFITPQQNGASNCGQANANATVTIDVLAADLAGAAAGTYSGTFNLDALQRQNPFRYTIDNFVVTIPELVQLSDLDDIDLGTFDGSSNAVGSDDLCIFRNGAAAYALRASGGTNAADPFVLSNGAATIPFSVAFREGTNAFVTRNPGQPLGGLTGSNVQNCGGATNAEVQVTVNSVDMMAQAPGTFAGILYITAEPQ